MLPFPLADIRLTAWHLVINDSFQTYEVEAKLQMMHGGEIVSGGEIISFFSGELSKAKMQSPKGKVVYCFDEDKKTVRYRAPDDFRQSYVAGPAEQLYIIARRIVSDYVLAGFVRCNHRIELVDGNHPRKRHPKGTAVRYTTKPHKAAETALSAFLDSRTLRKEVMVAEEELD